MRQKSRPLDETRFSVSSTTNLATGGNVVFAAGNQVYSHQKARSRVRLMTDYSAAGGNHHHATQRLYSNRAS